MQIGVLKVTLVGAKIFIDTEVFTKMDPFVTIGFKGQISRSKTINEGGDNPTWSDSFLFKDCLQNDSFTFKMMQQDVFSDDFIGEKQVPLGLLMHSGEKIILLQKNKQVTANLVIRTNFYFNPILASLQTIYSQVQTKQFYSPLVQQFTTQVLHVDPFITHLLNNIHAHKEMMSQAMHTQYKNIIETHISEQKVRKSSSLMKTVEESSGLDRHLLKLGDLVVTVI